MTLTKEIQNKIKSTQSTQKITRAMEMVATSKMRKAQNAMQASVPYAKALRKVIAHMNGMNLKLDHPFMKNAHINTIGLLIISTDRGLCGGLNGNLFRLALNKIQEAQEKNKNICLFLIGSKAQQFFSRFGLETLSAASDLPNQPEFEDIKDVADSALQAFLDNKIQNLFVLHNYFTSVIVQKPTVFQLLPTQLIEDENKEEKQGGWDYLYEPSANAVLHKLLKQYFEHLIYYSVVQNIACEQSSRMLAMRNASDNANDIIKDLSLQYNKNRQSAITQELTEIVSGADAIS